MNKWMKKAIDSGTPEFKAYAEYVIESMPEVTLPTLREMFKHNASVLEYKNQVERIERKVRSNHD